MDPTTAVALIGVALLVAGAALLLINRYRDAKAALRNNLTFYEAAYLRREGFLQTCESYELRSFDGGLSWYAVSYGHEKKTLTILGFAEEIHPGLMSHLPGLDVLTSYIDDHGPIGSKGAVSARELAVLQSAGFQITCSK